MDERLYGKINWYNKDKGYGFIDVLGEDWQIFFHIRNMLEGGVLEHEVKEGLYVSFIVGDNRGKTMADEIRKDEGAVNGNY